ncbi:MAG TPA: hypothetical protein VHZ99_12915 [Steroidobacteraceae bacterium]|jgi:hypothetical protein|nr:hypothetical protein [Steroidobacteraceae bacterium]
MSDAVPAEPMTNPTSTDRPVTPSLSEFLESAAVLANATVSVACEYIGARYDLLLPDVHLFCNAAQCGRPEAFAPEAERWTLPDRSTWTELKFLRYSCRGCGKSTKLYAVRIRFSNESLHEAAFTKIGEEPPNIGPTPKALRDLLGEAWVLYLKGVRSQLAGLELGAFVYFRRVVERIWPVLIERFVQLSQYDASLDQLAALKDAKDTRQINRSMEVALESIPASIFIDGHNPLDGLTDAYGNQTKEYTSAECSQRADRLRSALNQLADITSKVPGAG